MEANWVLPAALALAVLGVGSSIGSVDITTDQIESGRKDGCLQTVYRNEIGVKEATGNNDGPRVGEYLRYCGLGEGYEWCAAFVSWCHGQAGYAKPRNAWAAALFPAKRTVWTTKNRATNNTTPTRGDVFGIYMASKSRIGHCGFVDEWDAKWCITVEGNVNNAVVRKRRSVKTIRTVSRWTGAVNE
ncbi:MAG TPA: CHAP domain-containing protein [Parapedobacter sp.]|uniref:CHAP domain-containing protein n=1 Tax=Parapedobacter sp. TaxID=1958893 RepID=UPI002C4AD2E6|nr:CHAP domain-containing protein [Parapedobacter sp.]HWK58465.1 CHAP domain-containing protein [Parapedobacter sp.]